MLGTAVVARLGYLGERVTGADLPEIDLTDEATVASLLETMRPTHVIHCAAYTDVNGAESHEGVCRKVNVSASSLLARACAEWDARLVYISTDYVFDGAARHPYRVEDKPNPMGVYAQSKFDGEKAVAEGLLNHQIARTAWLYGHGKGNFVTAILGGLAKGGTLKVVSDETGNPTYAVDLAAALVELSKCAETGVFHLVNEGFCTRFELARKIAEFGGYDPERILPIRSEEWPSPVKRPLWSVLDSSRACSVGVRPLRRWPDALKDFIGTLASRPEASRATRRIAE